jgi:hypothetical protein
MAKAVFGPFNLQVVTSDRITRERSNMIAADERQHGDGTALPN